MDVPIMIFMRDLDCFDFKWLLYSQTSCLFLFDKRIAFTHTIFTGPMINLYVRTSHAVITKSGMHPSVFEGKHVSTDHCRILSLKTILMGSKPIVIVFMIVDFK